MSAMNPTRWPAGKRAAVSLSYDDGIPCHFETVAPLFERLGLRATFYVPVVTGLRLHTRAFADLAARGFELGNHTVFHPCRCEGDRVNWLNPAFDLGTYNERRWNEEIQVANFALNLVDGQTERTFGNTCFDNWIGPDGERICLEPYMERYFLAARGQLTGQPVCLEPINYWNLGTVEADYRTFADLRAEIEGVVSAGGWIIYTMHGVGADTHKLFIDEGEHRQLLEWLAERREQIWTAPVIEVVRHLRKG